MSDSFVRWRNEDGSYDGPAMLADLPGVPITRVRAIFSALEAKDMRITPWEFEEIPYQDGSGSPKEIP